MFCIKKDISTSVGDEGGFAPNLKSSDEAFEVILNAIEHAGYKAGKDIYLALDSAASEMYNKGKYDAFKSHDKTRTSEEMVELYKKMISDFPIVSLEDAMGEEDWDGWKLLTKELGDKIQLVGDDIFVTNKEILKKGIEQNICKLNTDKAQPDWHSYRNSGYYGACKIRRIHLCNQPQKRRDRRCYNI